MPGKSPARRFRALRNARPPALAAALAVLAAIVAGCGSDGDGSIPPEVADGLLGRVDAVEQSVAAGDCDLAEQQAEALVSEVGALPAEVEAEVERGLVEGAAQLAELTRAECRQTTGATGVQETDQVEPTPEEEVQPEEQLPDEDEEQQPDEEQPEEEQPPTEGEDGGQGTDGGGEEQPPTEGEDGGGEQPPTGGTEPETGGVISPESGQGQ
jgi:hypothetical protein